MRIFHVLGVVALGAVALAQHGPPQQAPQQAPQNSQQAAAARVYAPAAVHFVNIGEKLEGDYKFGYDTGKGNEGGQSFREETRLPDGTVKGAYGFIDAAGKMRIIRYTAGKDGFKAEGDIYQDGAPANTPGLNGPSQAAAPQPQPQPQPQPRPQPQYQAPVAYRPPPQPQPQYQPQPQPQYQPQPQPQPQYQAPAYQPPAYQQPQYRPQYNSPAAPQYGPQSIQYRPQYPSYASGSPNYGNQVSGGYRQPAGQLYAAAQTHVPQRLEPAFPDFFRQGSTAPAPRAAAYQAPPNYQPSPAYRGTVSAAPVNPVQNYAPQYRPQPQYETPRAQPQQQAPQYQPAPQQYQPAQYQAPRPAAAAPQQFAPQALEGKKKYEDGQYDPELTKPGLYYPDLYEKLPVDGKSTAGGAPNIEGYQPAPRNLGYFDPSLLAYNIGAQRPTPQAKAQKAAAASKAS